MRRGNVLFFGLLTGCLLLPASGFAQMYQWRDANGRVVFSDTPPPPNIPPGSIMKAPKARAAPAPAPASAATEGKAEGGAAVSGTAPGAPGATAKAAAPKSVAEREADFKKRQAEAAAKAEKDQQTASDDKRREEQCRGMRQSLAALESGQRARRFNDKGEPYFLEDADRGREVEKYRKDMATAKCG